jgi:hypothetical protein
MLFSSGTSSVVYYRLALPNDICLEAYRRMYEASPSPSSRAVGKVDKVNAAGRSLARSGCCDVVMSSLVDSKSSACKRLRMSL